MTPESQSPTQTFHAGNYVAAALVGDPEDWRHYAALGIVGRTEQALEGLSHFSGPDPDFYRAATHWIAGDEQTARRILEPLPGAWAQNLLGLLRKPRLSVLAQLPADRQPPWDLLRAAERDTKFEVRNISFHPDDLPNDPSADIRSFYDARFPPDFYACLMVEWHLLPSGLRQLPCPLLGATTDYDLHIQALYPWLPVFDTLIVSSHTEWEEVRRLTPGHVASFPALAGVSTDLPSLSEEERVIDLFFSGTTQHPYHPDKSRLLCQALGIPDLRFSIENGFLSMRDYLRCLGRSRVCYTYVRHPGALPTRGLDALSMGCAVAAQRDCVLKLYLGAEEGLALYDADAGDLPAVLRSLLQAWPEFERRARRGAEIVRSQFALPVVASRYLRFLTFLAARPRPPRADVQPEQKRMTVWRGWTPRDPDVREQMLLRTLTRGYAALERARVPDIRRYIDIARALVLEAAAHAEHGAKTVTPPEQLVSGALNLYRTALSVFPDSPVLLLNYVRVSMHLAGSAEATRAAELLRGALERPPGSWRIDPLEDVYPWDFYPEGFHYRRYFDCVTAGLMTGQAAQADLRDTLLASLHFYAARSDENTVFHLEEAARLDPEFPFYSLALADRLLRSGAESDAVRARALLIRLAQGSVVYEQAIERLQACRDRGADDLPEMNRLTSMWKQARRSTGYAHEGWLAKPDQTGVLSTPSAEEQPGAPAKPRKHATVTVGPLGDPERPARLSALVPLYQAERFLPGMLEDLEAQTAAGEMQIVLCDTGSPQNERGIVAEFQRRYGNLVYIRTEHRENSHAALNRCISAATGAYLTLACADDRHRPDALELLADALDAQQEVGLVWADSLITRLPNETFARNSAEHRFVWPEFSLRQALMHNIFGPQPMWRRKLHETAGVFQAEYEIAADYDLFLRLAWLGGALHLPEALGLYLEGGGNEARNQPLCRQETQRIAAHYRMAIPLEEIYSALRQSRDPLLARTAALVDFGNCILTGGCADPEMAARFYREALALAPAHPVVRNNLAVALCMQGATAEGISLLSGLAEAGDVEAATNLRRVRSHPAEAGAIRVGSILHPVLEELPPVVLPEAVRRPLHSSGMPHRQTASATRRHSAAPEGFSFLIVTAGRRPALTRAVFRSIAAQQIPACEILVCGSISSFEETPEEYGIAIQYLPAEEAAEAGRLGLMRNLAAAAARYSRLVVLDDDILLAHDWYAAVGCFRDECDIQTSRVQLPDGTRYWDRVCRRAGRSPQVLLRDDEDDPAIFMSGGAGWLMRDYVARSVRWDDSRGFYQEEDIDFAGRCRAEGFSIGHNSRATVYHADPTYTSIGRWTLRRTEGKKHTWVADALADYRAQEIFLEGAALLGKDRTAEAVDCFRYGLLRFPDYTAFHHALQGVVQRSGGEIPGVVWRPGGDPDYVRLLKEILPDPEARDAAGGCPPEAVFDLPDRLESPKEPLPAHAGRNARVLFRAGSPMIRLDSGDLAREASPFLTAAEAAGLHLALQPVRCTEQELELPVSEEARLQSSRGRQAPSGGIHISALFPSAFTRRSDALQNIGRAACDTDRPPESWKLACQRMDAVWVPSQFHRDCYVQAGLPPQMVFVVPPCLKPGVWDPAVKPLPVQGARAFNFLSILEWSYASGWDLLVRAFVKEFRDTDDVALILRARSARGYSTQQMTESIIACVKTALSGNLRHMPTLVLSDEEIPVENLPNLFRSVDCYAAPARSGAWNQHCLEAMAMGLPVIASDWGAPRDYLRPETGFPIACSMCAVSEEAAREMPLYRGMGWAEPDGVHLRKLLRRVYHRRSMAQEIGAKARAETLTRFHYTQTAAAIRAALSAADIDLPAPGVKLPATIDFLLG